MGQISKKKSSRPADIEIMQYCALAIINEKLLNEETDIYLSKADALNWLRNYLLKRGWKPDLINAFFDTTIAESIK